jgi:hypothetical protein
MKKKLDKRFQIHSNQRKLTREYKLQLPQFIEALSGRKGGAYNMSSNVAASIFTGSH